MLCRFLKSMPYRQTKWISKPNFQALISTQHEAHSYPVHNQYKSMDIKILPALQDNYMYLIIDKATNEAAVVDPVEPNVVLQAIQEHDVILTTVLTTHHHWQTKWISKPNFQALISTQHEAHSYPVHNQYKSMDIKILPALQDNYMYLIIDKATNEAAVVDPVEPNVVLQAIQEHDVILTTVLTTHHHWDHAGGNQDLARQIPGLKVYGGDDRINALTNKIQHNNKFNIGNLNVQCLFTPCHTAGDYCYFVTAPEGGQNEAVLFSGDTLFVSGCGKFFEGTAEQMFQALISILSHLPNQTKVFCGHEYSLPNLKFAAFVEPDNKEVLRKMAWSTLRRNQGLPAIPSTIGEEKLYNPFMRVTQPAIMKHVGKTDSIQTMKALRLERDNFQG